MNEALLLLIGGAIVTLQGWQLATIVAIKTELVKLQQNFANTETSANLLQMFNHGAAQ